MKNLQALAMFAILLLVITLSGCQSPINALPPPPGSIAPIKPLTEQMTVNIYWDATISMQGFTKLAAGNVYRNLPDTLGDIGNLLGEVHFFRFGEQVMPVEGREYRRFSESGYYTESITSFASVLDAADPEQLSIVVTDLFESDADWSNVTQKLREKYFSKDLSVAIIGIKNSFSGDIFDVGLNAATFSYDSGDDPARFRPFYLFLMGSELQLRAFLEQWQEKGVPAYDIQYVTFSEYFTSQVTILRVSDAKNTDKENLLEDNSLSKSDDRLQEVVIPNRKEKVNLRLPGKFQKYPYACDLKNDKLEKHVKIFTLSDEGQWNEQEGKWQQQESKGANISFSLDGNSCELNLTFQPEGILPQGQIGLLQVQIVPSRQSVDLPPWISEWDMGNIDIAPEQFDGSKTVNLKHIADSLKDSLLTSIQPTIVELDLVVDGR